MENSLFKKEGDWWVLQLAEHWKIKVCTGHKKLLLFCNGEFLGVSETPEQILNWLDNLVG